MVESGSGVLFASPRGLSKERNALGFAESYLGLGILRYVLLQ